jgi:surfactin synthase thioesterase subunit
MNKAIRSKRRGQTSKDEDAIARREWYESMENIVFVKDSKHKRPDSQAAMIAANMPKTGDDSGSLGSVDVHGFFNSDAKSVSFSGLSRGSPSLLDGGNSFSAASSPDSKASLIKPKHEFKSFALVLAEESEAKERSRGQMEEKEPDIIPFTVPENLDPRRWLIKLNELPMGDKLATRLICFPGVNGSHILFHKWGDYLDDMGIELWAVCYPGRAHRVCEEPMEVVNDIAECVVEAMYLLELLPELDKDNKIVSKDKGGAEEEFDDVDEEESNNSSLSSVEDDEPKTMFFGHGLGGLIAYEAMRAMQERFGILVSDLSEDDLNSVDTTVLLRDASHLVHHCIISGCETPSKITKFNRDRFNTKHFCGSDAETTKLVQEMGLYRDHCNTKLFINRHLRPCLPYIRNDLKIKEKYFLRGYKWVSDNRNSSFGSSGVVAGKDIYKEESFVGTGYQLFCPITTIGAVDDDTCPEEELYEWYKFSTKRHAQYMLQSGKHMYMNDYSNTNREFGVNTEELLEKIRHICLHNRLPGQKEDELCVIREDGTYDEGSEEEEDEDVFPI